MVTEGTHPWTTFRDLSSLVESVIVRREPGRRPELEAALRKHKPSFIALLKNTARCPEDAELVKKASLKTAEVPGCSHYTLNLQICEEALIVSELFNLNEISSLQLLVQGEEQLSQYPGLTRGLVAVLLYYDSRKALVQSLRSLIQSRMGLTWTLETPQDIAQLTTQYTTRLLEEGLVDKVLTLLKELDWIRECANLQKHMALGDAKHRKQVRDLFEDIRQGLADCIYCYAAQSGLPKSDVVRLFDFLSKIKPSEGTAAGVLDNVTLTLTMAALYTMDISALVKCEDGEEAVQSLPLVKDTDFIGAIHKELTNHNKRWEHPVILSLLQFGWSMLLCSMRSLSQHSTALNYVDEDEAVLDLALENRVFHCLPEYVLSNTTLFKEEFYIRRLHQLITDLIVLMPLKVKELRNRADDAGRNKLMHDQEGISYMMPLAGQHFEHLLNTISRLYKNDNLGLILEYWCPPEGGGERLPHRQVSLNKFVRLAGDLLVPSLFMPYLDMLVSLSGHPQAALHCFNLLKVSGQNQVSWDHFFNSLQQYFLNLRQGVPQGPLSSAVMETSTIYMHRPMTRGISPQEIKGLSSVLRLIQAVCTHSDVARVAIGDNSVWQPVLIFVGLLGCSVPTNLKSDILLTLSSLAKSPEFSLLIWQSLESSQLLPEAKPLQNIGGSTNSLSHQGIISELEEIESRYEEYPMTVSFLTLLDTLTENSIPSNLGSGTRVPGFDPYLSFIRDYVFLRFHTRPYKIASEKWKVAAICVKLLLKLLKEYEPVIGIFEKEAHPGFKIVVHLLQMSEMLRMVMFILDEGCSLLETYNDFAGKDFLEDSCLYSLQLLETGLKIQESVLEAARSSNTSLMLTALDKLLLGINPRSGRPDHTLNICKFVTFSWWLPNHAAAAVNVLSYLSSSVSAQPGLLATVTSSEAIANSVVKGFTDVLDDDFDYDGENADVLGLAKIAIVKLLQSGLDMPAPSFSHFLLGFDLKRGVSKTNLQQPGILGGIRTPFHALLGILRPVEPRVPPVSLFNQPHLCETAYKLIYTLASNQATSEPTLRYLRSSEDFLSTQLSLLPLNFEDGREPSVYALKAVSWLLKTVAVELKIVSTSRLRSQISHLTGLLLDSSMSGRIMDGQADDSQFLCGYVTDDTLAQLSRAVTSINPTVQADCHGQHRLLALLNFIDFNETPIDPPTWQLFDDAQVSQVLKNCETVSNTGERFIKIQELHQILNAELSNLQGASCLNQRQLIQQEIQNILLYAVKWNSIQEESLTRRQLLDAWRQVTEVLLCSIPLDILPSSSKQQLLLELLQTLLNKVLQDGTMSELSNKVSGVLLLLLAALRQTYVLTAFVDNPTLMGDSFVPILDAQGGINNTNSKKTASNRVYSTALQVILKGLVQWIQGTSASSQRVRSNLYGALLNYLRIGKGEKISPKSGKDINSLELSDQGKLRKANLEVLTGFGDNFLEIVCRDSVSGHDIRRMLAMSVLEELIALDSKGSWIWYLSNQGYLRHLIESLKTEDEGLLQLMTATTRNEGNLRTLYTYESKIGMLTRLASTISGAELLLESGLMLRLAEIQVFSARPEPPSEVGAPSALDRYHQILFPVLRLCQAILSSLGGVHNRSATVQVLHFISANEDLVRSILRNNVKIIYRHRSLEEDLSALQELSLLTGVISRCAVNDDVQDVESLGNLSRLQRLMLSLIPQFNLSESVKEYENNNQSNAIRLLLEIHANVMAYARNIVTLSANNSKYCRILFTPSLSEAYGTDNREHPSIAIPSRPPSLGHLFTVLRSLSSHLISAHSSLTDLQDKLSSIEHLSSAELSSLLNPDEVIGKSTDKRLLGARKIQTLINNKEHEVSLAGSAIESACLLLWRHMEHFLLYASKSEGTPYQKAIKRLNDEPQMPGDTRSILLSTRVPSDVSEKLKEESISVFSDSLFMKLQDVEQLYSKKHSSVGFLEAMIRKLKRLSSLHT